MADQIDPNLIAALLARAPTSNIGLATGTMPPSGPVAEPYKPSTMDMIARALIGSQPPERGSMGGALSDLMLGTRGHGPTGPLPGGLSVADLTPVGPGAQYIDRSAQGDIPGAMAQVPGMVLTAPRLGMRVLDDVGGAIGGAVDAGRAGLARAGEMAAARPATSTAAAASGAAIGASPEAGDARVDHPDRPKPPSAPPALPSFDDFLARKHTAERERLGTGYGGKSQARTTAAAEAEYARLKVETDKQQAAHARAMDEWATRASQFDKDQAERDRQAEFKHGFSERHPMANVALMAAGYLAPFSIARNAANATNTGRQALVDKFTGARAAEDPSRMAEAALAAYRAERVPTSTMDKLKTAATVAAPAEAQSLGRVIDMATTGSDTEAYKKAQDELTSADYYKKLIPQLMSGGVLYSLGGKLPSPVSGVMDLKKYDAPTYGMMQRDFVPRATEPRPGTFGMMERPVDPTAESTTAHIAQILRAMADQRMRTEATAAEAERVTRGVRNATNGTTFDNLRRRRPINED